MDERQVKELKKLGVDVAYLQNLPRGRAGVEWPPAWKMACKMIFVAGYNPANIEEMLDGPNRQTIYEWAQRDEWAKEREDFIAKTETKIKEKMSETLADVNSRHLRALQTMQNAGMLAIVEKKVTAKTLEGTISAVISAIRAERDVSKMTGGNSNTTINNDNRIQSIVLSMDDIPPDKIDEFLELNRKKIELEDQMNSLTKATIKELPAGESDTIDETNSFIEDDIDDEPKEETFNQD